MPPRTTPPTTTATLPTTSAVLMRDGPSALSHPLYAAIETRNPSPRAQDASVLTLPPARNSKDAGKCKASGPVDGPRPGVKNIRAGLMPGRTIRRPALAASQEAWDLQIIGGVFLGLFGFRMWLGHRWRRDGDGRCRALLDRGRLALVHRPFETTDRTSLLERGRDDRDLDLATHPFVDDRAEDDVRLGIRRRVDDLRGLVHFEERQIGAAGNGEEDAARTIDRLLEERRHDRLTRRVRGARLA